MRTRRSQVASRGPLSRASRQEHSRTSRVEEWPYESGGQMS